jgi:hypothetical protein
MRFLLSHSRNGTGKNMSTLTLILDFVAISKLSKSEIETSVQTSSCRLVDDLKKQGFSGSSLYLFSHIFTLVYEFTNVFPHIL